MIMKKLCGNIEIYTWFMRGNREGSRLLLRGLCVDLVSGFAIRKTVYIHTIFTRYYLRCSSRGIYNFRTLTRYHPSRLSAGRWRESRNRESFSESLYPFPYAALASGVHPDRVAGGDCDHRRTRGAVAAGHPKGPRSRVPHAVPEQHEADRHRSARLQRSEQVLPQLRRVPLGRRQRDRVQPALDVHAHPPVPGAERHLLPDRPDAGVQRPGPAGRVGGQREHGRSRTRSRRSSVQPTRSAPRAGWTRWATGTSTT